MTWNIPDIKITNYLLDPNHKGNSGKAKNSDFVTAYPDQALIAYSSTTW